MSVYQIFMCLLWLLLQFVVLALYWDVPPIKSEEEGLRMEMKQEDEEEEAPLIRGDEQLAHTYRAVNLDQLGDSSSSSSLSETHSLHGVANPFKNFSASRGE